MLSELERLEAPPAADLDEEALAAYITSFEADKQVWGEVLAENLGRLERGSRSLHWTDTTGSNWGTKVAPSSRGMTYNDINRPKAYGTVPERAENRNLTPRGAVREPYHERMPVLEEYTLLDKYELWADNVSTLYEEAKSRQWNSTTDIPWAELEPVSEDLEKAACQFATFLTEVEFVAGDFPARWIYRIPQDFFEVKNFLVTQMMDEARHMEVFRKRALAGGGGLLHVSPAFEWGLKAILEAPTHTTGTYLLNVLGEGFVLSCFRAGEFLARTHVDREIFRRCLQDEARHVAYGTMELKSYLEHHPEPAAALERMHRFADVGELVVLSGMTDPCLLEPVAVLMGGSLADIDEGFEGIGFLWTTVREEYLQRCDRAGFDRRERCKIPESLPGDVLTTGTAREPPRRRVHLQPAIRRYRAASRRVLAFDFRCIPVNERQLVRGERQPSSGVPFPLYSGKGTPLAAGAHTGRDGRVGCGAQGPPPPPGKSAARLTNGRS